MYGLPIFRKETISNPPPPCPSLFGCCVGPGCPPPFLKSALKLVQMVEGHYCIIIGADMKTIAAWGGANRFGQTGVASNPKKPTSAIINWKSGLPQYISKVFSLGYNNFTIFRTEDNQLYGTGNNNNYILNKPKRIVYPTYNQIADKVIDFCPSYNSYLLYVKSNGKVYGLGASNVGFGFPTSGMKDLTKDDGADSNYLGIDNATKVFTTSPLGSNHKSFILKKNGTVMACGYNTDGCLGVNKTDAIVNVWSEVKTSVDGGVTFHTLSGVVDVITSNSVTAGGANGSTERWAGGGPSGHMSSYFLTNDGSVYTCGNNKFGQLGIGLSNTTTRNYASKTTISKGSSICTTAGGTSVLVTTTDDKVYTWGNNQWGQLGHGTRTDTFTCTQATFPSKKILMAHGGGMYGVINGAFLVVCADGTVYGVGFNETFALGITTAGVPNAGPITTFTKNEYFGENPIQNQDPERYPLILSGSIVTTDFKIRSAQLFTNKVVLGTTEAVYVTKGMSVSGIGIPAGTVVNLVDLKTNEILLSNPATVTNTNATLRYDKVVKVYQADLCGYGTEMAQKVVTSDGDLYMSGWNQDLTSYFTDGWNFNYYVATQNVQVPTFFDAKKFL